MAVLEIKEISKSYEGSLAVDRLSLTLDAGQILGFIGPNGAGKTTTIRIVAGLLQPSRGEVLVGGHSVRRQPLKTRALTGYMPDVFGAYENTTVYEYLDFFAQAFLIKKSDRERLIGDVLELTELKDLKEREAVTLSRGQSQRVSLARCLLHDPDLLLLDEPASGLDPRARIEFRELIRELGRMGKAVLLSSHILTELEDLCTHVAIIDHGKLVSAGAQDEVSNGIGGEGRFRVILVEGAEAAASALLAIPGLTVEIINERELTGVHPGSAEDASEVVALLVNRGFRVMKFIQEKADLEKVFLHMTK
ncbi:MAG: ABC transporter ATP-binding protein [Planctomycetota bacterium]|nr:ABC transporter ATP-binding protein [Planctomycetota bacterium]